MEPEISTVNIVENAADSLKGVAFSTAMKVWKSIGIVVGRQLEEGRAVRIERFGTIGFNNTGGTIFVLAAEFAQANRVRGAAKQVLGSNPTAKLSMTHLAAETEIDRDLVKNVVDRIFLLVNQTTKKGKSLRMSFLPVGDFVCMEDVVKFHFQKVFVQKLKQQQQRGIQTPRTLRKKTRPASASEYDTRSIQSQSIYSVRSTATMRPGSARSTISSASRRAESKLSSTFSNDSKIPEFKLPLDVKSYYSDENSPPKSELSVKPMTVVDRVKQRIVQRGGANGINAVSRVLRIMDDSGDKKLSKQELKYGLRDYGIDLNQQELNELMNYFDRDSDGVITFDEFLVALRGDMSERRLSFVHQAFKIVDQTGDGVVTIEDLQDKYDVSKHPEVMARKKTKEQVLKEFLTQWDTGEKDGIVTKEEFIEYYRVCIDYLRKVQ